MPLPRSSSLANPIAATPRCFCGRAIAFTSASAITEDEPQIYCSVSCARLDSMSALCAQEAVQRSPKGRMKAVLRLGRKEAIAKSSHYRRTEREGHRKKLIGKGIGTMRAERELAAAANEQALPVATATVAEDQQRPALRSKPTMHNLKEASKDAGLGIGLKKSFAKLELQHTLLSDSDDEYGDDDSEDFARLYSAAAREEDIGEQQPPKTVLQSYWSSSSLASTARSDSSFMNETELSASSSTSSLASTSSSVYSEGSTAPLRLGLAEGSCSDNLLSSPSLDSLFTPLVIQGESFHSSLLKGGLFGSAFDVDEAAERTPKIGHTAGGGQARFERPWYTDASRMEERREIRRRP